MQDSIIENLARVSTRALFKAYAAQYFSEKALSEGSVRSLLLEEFTDEDANNLQKAVDEINGIIDGFAGKVGDFESFQPVLDGLAKYAGELPDAAAIIDLMMGGDGKALAKGVEEFTSKARTLSSDVAALIQVVEAMKKDLGNLEPSDPNKKISELSELGKEGGGYPDAGKLEAGIIKAYEPPGWFEKAWQAGTKEAEKEGGGMFKKAMGFLSGILKGTSARVVEPAVVATAIMGLTPEQLGGLDLSGEQKTMQDIAVQLGAGTGDAAGAATSQQSAGEVDPSAPDEKAAQAGLEALKKGDSDKVKGIFDAIKGSLDEDDVAIFQAVLGGAKIADLPDHQQQYMNGILQLFAGGVDVAPDQVVDAAEEAVEAADETVASEFGDMEALMKLADTHLGNGGGNLVQAALGDEEIKGLFAHKEIQYSFPLHESRLTSLLLEAEGEGIPLADFGAALPPIAKLLGVGEPKEDALSAWATAVNDELGGINGKTFDVGAAAGEGAGGFSEEAVKAAATAATGYAKEGLGDAFGDKAALYGADVIQKISAALGADEALSAKVSGEDAEGLDVDTFKKTLEAAGALDLKALGAEGEDASEAEVLQYIMYIGKGINDGTGQEIVIGADALEAEIEKLAGDSGGPVDDALMSAAADASGEPEAPAIAIGHALDGWHDGLSKSAQSVLKAKGRFDGLKTSIDASLESAASAIAAEVEKAVDAWWKENEETLVKSKKFSKTNGETLRAEIPKIAASMLQQKAESNVRLTQRVIHKSVRRYLNKKYLGGEVLFESIRWQKLAGLRG